MLSQARLGTEIMSSRSVWPRRTSSNKGVVLCLRRPAWFAVDHVETEHLKRSS